MSEPFVLSVHPRSWRGSRDNVAPSRLLDEEWVDCRNVDSRFCRRRRGEVLSAQPEGGVNVLAIGHYHRPDGTISQVIFTSAGKIWDGGVLVKSGLSAVTNTMLVPGPGTMFMLNGINVPQWRDPTDGVWKDLQGLPSGWKPKYAAFHPLNHRLYLAPTTGGVDYYAWSNPDFTGSNLSFVATGGGGSEPLGGTREPITGLMHGLGDDLGIFTTEHVFQIRGLDPSNWRPRFVSGDVGNTAPRSLLNIGHGTFFAHTSGCYLVNAVGALTFPPLTEPRQALWDTLVQSLESQLQYIHAAWSANEHTVYLFVPADSTGMMKQLWKFYLPDGSITIHNVSAYHSTYKPSGKVLVGLSNGVIADLLGGSDDLGTAITGWVKTRIYGDPTRVRMWGIQQKMVVSFAPLSGGVVTVTPTIYRQHERGPVTGDAQTVALTTSGDEVRATLRLPPDPGWGLQLLISGTSAWQFWGFDVEGTIEDIE